MNRQGGNSIPVHAELIFHDADGKVQSLSVDNDTGSIVVQAELIFRDSEGNTHSLAFDDGLMVRSELVFRDRDDDIQELSIDGTTNAISTITYAHYETHIGRHFMYTDSVELDSGVSQDYLITTPDTTRWAHMIFHLDGYGITQWQFYEDSDKNGTTLQTVGNNNRNSLLAPGVTIHKGTSGGTTDGNLAYSYKGGAATGNARTATDSGNEEEIILKQNTKYILRVTSSSNDNYTNTRLEWYEHTNK